MSGETIELAKNWNAGKMKFPAVFQQKMDGMPVRLMRTNTSVIAVSRQGEPVKSVQHICDQLYGLLPGECVVLEVLVPGLPFKTSTGLIRQTKKQVPEAIGYLFDATIKDQVGYLARLQKTSIVVLGDCIKAMPNQCIVYNAEQAEAKAQQLPKDAEGACLHWVDKPFEPGKRLWTFQRIKPQPTIDLCLYSYEEAIDKYGDPKGMVGRVNVWYKGKVIGVGPGNMTHEERITLWRDYGDRNLLKDSGLIVEVKYMPDDTYDALRQPTFVRFRPDKETADA